MSTNITELNIFGAIQEAENERTEKFVDRMVHLCRQLNYDRDKCREMVDGYIAQQGGDLDKVEALIHDMEVKAGLVKAGLPVQKPEPSPPPPPAEPNPEASKVWAPKVGDWVKYPLWHDGTTQYFGYGLFQRTTPGGSWTVLGKLSEEEPCPVEEFEDDCLNFEPGSAQEYLDQIQNRAWAQFIDNTRVFALHNAIANGRDKMSFAVLSEFDTKVEELIQTKDRPHCWLTYNRETLTVWLSNLEKGPHRTLSYVEFGVEIDNATKSGDKEMLELLEWIKGRTRPNGEQLKGAGSIPFSFDAALVERFIGEGTDDEKPTAEVTNIFGDTPKEEAAEPQQENTEEAPPDLPKTSEGRYFTVFNNSDLRVDPLTGEVRDLHWSLQKLGWTELPQLPEKPSKEQLEEFEAKVDQVVDRSLALRDQTARWRQSCADRCKPLDGAADFWDAFVEPLAKQLAKYKLKGKAQTMKLASGHVSFTKSGGPMVFDLDLAKKEITKQVTERTVSRLSDTLREAGFAEEDIAATVDAITEAVYDVPEELSGIAEVKVAVDGTKLGTAVRAGKFEKLPGTKKVTEDRFAKVAIKSPEKKGGTDAESRQED